MNCEATDHVKRVVELLQAWSMMRSGPTRRLCLQTVKTQRMPPRHTAGAGAASVQPTFRKSYLRYHLPLITPQDPGHYLLDRTHPPQYWHSLGSRTYRLISVTSVLLFSLLRGTGNNAMDEPKEGPRRGALDQSYTLEKKSPLSGWWSNGQIIEALYPVRSFI